MLTIEAMPNRESVSSFTRELEENLCEFLGTIKRHKESSALIEYCTEVSLV